MLTSFLFLILTIFSSSNSRAADLVYVAADGTLMREEHILSVAVDHASSASAPNLVSVHTPTVSCYLKIGDVEVASRLQEQLINEDDTFIQCTGPYKKLRVAKNETSDIYVEAESFTLGHTPTEERAESQKKFAKIAKLF